MSYVLKIKEFTVKNFRVFNKLTVNFEADDYICLVGKNGSGKTSVLEALNICLSENNSKFNNIQETDFYCDDPIELSIKFDKPFFFSFEEGGFERLIPCDNIKKTISRRSRKEQGSFFSPPFDIKIEFLPADYSPTNTDFAVLKAEIAEYIPSNAHLVRAFREIPIDQTSSSGGKQYEYSIESRPTEFRSVAIYGVKYLPKVLFPKVFYFDKNRSRELLSEYNTTFAKIITELDWRFKKKLLRLDETESRALFEQYDSLKQKMEELENYKEELVEPVVTSMRNHLGINFDDGVEFFFFNLYCPYESSVFGHRTNEKQIVPVSNYGSGIASLMALTFLIEFAKQSKESILILIDEPEIHLQSDLQKKLYRFLKTIGFQTVLSSHSHLFLDKEVIRNNFCFECDSKGKVGMKRCNQLEFADAQFRLLGNSLDDFYIPDNVLLVEGKYDKFVLAKCLTLLDRGDLSLQILDCGGYAEIPTKADRYDQVLGHILSGTSRFKDYIKKSLRIIVDGDVSDTKISGWKSAYTLPDESVKHLAPDQKGLEFLYPESLVRTCIAGTKLQDGTDLAAKSKIEIVSIILADDDIEDKTQCQQTDNRVSKFRLNKFVEENMTTEILNSEECNDLKAIIDWIIGEPT